MSREFAHFIAQNPKKESIHHATLNELNCTRMVGLYHPRP